MPDGFTSAVADRRTVLALRCKRSLSTTIAMLSKEKGPKTDAQSCVMPSFVDVVLSGQGYCKAVRPFDVSRLRRRWVVCAGKKVVRFDHFALDDCSATVMGRRRGGVGHCAVLLLIESGVF